MVEDSSTLVTQQTTEEDQNKVMPASRKSYPPPKRKLNIEVDPSKEVGSDGKLKSQKTAQLQKTARLTIPHAHLVAAYH